VTAETPSPLVPKLRFPEFKDMPGWESMQLSEVLDYEQPGRYIVEDISYQSTGTPVLTANKSFVLGCTDETDGIYDNVPVIIFDDFTTDTKYVDFAFKVKSSAIKILTSRNDDELKLVFELMSRIRFDPAQHKRYYISQYQHLQIPLPDKAEQQKISECLGSLDDLIVAEGRKLGALRQYKQGLMQQLFPQPGETVPKLRFPEFRDDLTWLTPQLAELYRFKRTNTLSRDKLNYETGTIRNIHYGDIHTKFNALFRVGNEHVPYVNPDVSANAFDKDAFCEEGDIVLADASEDLDDVGKAIEVVSLDRECVVAGTHTILGTRRGSVPVVGFGGQLFQSNAVRAGIMKEAQGVKVYGISTNRISAVLVPVPPTASEQQHIADSLGSLDDLIATAGRKLEALRQHKQGLMQQLFPTPEGNE